MMRQRTTLGSVFLGVVVGLPVALLVTLMLTMPPAAWAGACASSTLDIYTGAGFSCSIDDKIFSSFGYSGTGSGGAPVIPASGVGVIPCPSLDPSCIIIPAGEEGFVLTAPWAVTSFQTQDSSLIYTVTSLSSQIIDAVLSEAGTGATGTGVATVGETLISNGGSLSVSCPPCAPSTVTETFAPIGSLLVVTDIGVSAGTEGTAFQSDVGNAFSQLSVVPEPGTMALLGTALIMTAGLPGLRQRRARK
jgi:hypothetical protein